MITRKLALGIAALWMSAAAAAVAQESAAAKVDAIFGPLANEKTPGVAVLVRKNGQTVFARGYGMRELKEGKEAKNLKIDERTNFRLASCTKQFTAMAVMLLVHEGKLRYEDTLTKIFPEFPGYGSAITIRHLLNHTSGLPDYEALMKRAESRTIPIRPGHLEKHIIEIWSETRQIQDGGVSELLEKESVGKFPPGTQWSYSNSGYVMLGLVVAKVSGEPFAEFLRERIFAPLGMSETVAYEKGKNEVAHRAFGHTKEGGGWKKTDQSATSATLGDGGVYSAIADLEKWDEALAQHTLLGEREMQEALTPARLTDGLQPKWPEGEDRPAGTPVSYGFGWFLDPYKGHERMWHYGDTRGFHTYIARFFEERLTVVVLCNRTDLDPEALGLKVADVWWDRRDHHDSNDSRFRNSNALVSQAAKGAAILFHEF